MDIGGEMKNSFILVFGLFVLFGCAPKAPEPVAIMEIPFRKIDYLAEVKPLLDKRCVVCHSCYNSPCQLKLSSYEGLDRGASKEAVYNATRLTTMDPTRLFIDAQSTEEWRKKDFFSVTENTAMVGFNNSLMLQLLNHKMQNKDKTKGEYFSDDDTAYELNCTASQSQLGGYLKKHPNGGMPFGFPALEQVDFETIALWLSQGAKGPTADEQKALVTPSAQAEQAIEKWQDFFNDDSPKYQMTARYIYEHLFLAHINFSRDGKEFFELVRSKTPVGEPLKLIATVRPYDDPKVDRVYYRFRKIHSTIVHKTHMVITLDEAMFARVGELFIEPKWMVEPFVADYEPLKSANPFSIFEQIPPRSRYQFLLDHAHYIIMTFIRGPVCRGQMALNVIDDQFWIMFLDPDSDLSVRYPGFLKVQERNLRLPTERQSTLGIVNLYRDEYRRDARAYLKYREDYYMSHYYYGLGYDNIWKGNNQYDTPLLTVYRHFDSASVHRGALGDLPKTMWVVDYPLLERIYYALVAGFDVYGTVTHQVGVRLYMDSLRMEAESYFLDFMPQEKRSTMMHSWYVGVDKKKVAYYESKLPTKITYTTLNPKREFVEHLVKDYYPEFAHISFDNHNYLQEHEVVEFPESFKNKDDYLQAFKSVSREGTAFFKLVTDHKINLAVGRIHMEDEPDIVFSIVINRWHDNVSFLLKENAFLNPAKDRADFIEGFVGSYPNMFFDLRSDQVGKFLRMLSTYTGSEEDLKWLWEVGVNRGKQDFWVHYDWFQKRFKDEQPVQSGLFDLNRYYYKSF